MPVFHGVQIIPTCVFNKKDPIIVGVEVVEGIAKVRIDSALVLGLPLLVQDRTLWPTAAHCCSAVLVVSGRSADSCVVQCSVRTFCGLVCRAVGQQCKGIECQDVLQTCVLCSSSVLSVN